MHLYYIFGHGYFYHSWLALSAGAATYVIMHVVGFGFWDAAVKLTDAVGHMAPPIHDSQPASFPIKERLTAQCSPTTPVY